MKRKIMSVLIAICCTVSVTACAVQQQPSNVSQSTVISKNPVSVDPIDNNKPTLTKAQMLEDYDTMWRILDENYPHFNTLSRKYVSKGLDANYHLILKDQYRAKIEGMTTEGDEAVIEFIGLLNQCLIDVGEYTAHLGLILPDKFSNLWVYRDAVQKSQEFKEYQIWVDTIDNEKTLEMYDYYIALMKTQTDEDTQAGGNTSIHGQSGAESVPQYENLTLSILEDGKVAYIKIRSFAGRFMEKDIPRILEFYDQIKDCPNLIIDITDNGGGSGLYWQENIVAPNITEDITMRSVTMIMPGEVAREFVGSSYEGSTLKIEDVRNNPAYINLHKEDLDKLSQAQYDEEVVKASSKDVLYKGKIWLLVNDKVFSAAEGFAAMSKYSGFATVVGQTTAGDSGGSKDPLLATLPNSHLLFKFTADYLLNPDGSCNQEIGTIPDIETDTPLETCLELIKQEAE